MINKDVNLVSSGVALGAHLSVQCPPNHLKANASALGAPAPTQDVKCTQNCQADQLNCPKQVVC
jgi:hypothetical protein